MSSELNDLSRRRQWSKCQVSGGRELLCDMRNPPRGAMPRGGFRPRFPPGGPRVARPPGRPQPVAQTAPLRVNSCGAGLLPVWVPLKPSCTDCPGAMVAFQAAGLTVTWSPWVV